MKLLTDEIKKILPALYSTEDVLEGSPEGDDWRLFGMCDLGFGSPELGYVMLSELESVDVGFGMGIERDICVGPSELHPEWAAM